MPHRKRQTGAHLFSQLERGGKDPPEDFRFLDDFIRSGQSRQYELFIDGYNVLLRAHEKNLRSLHTNFTQIREQFIDAVAAKSGNFAKVWLVFDGVEDSSNARANVQIIYTDRNEKSADEVIIQRINAKKGRKILLVTGDEGIISSVEARIFALIDVDDFYTFLGE